MAPPPDAAPGPGEPDAMPPPVPCAVDEDCDDGLACTTDRCDQTEKLCAHTPDHSFCDNALICDGVEICHMVRGCEPGPLPDVPPGPECVDPGITTGQYHTCALLDDGEVRCWGFGAEGQLGYGDIVDVGDNEFPSEWGPVMREPGLVKQVVAGGLHTCILFVDGRVQCWGHNNDGQTGNGNFMVIGDDELPAGLVDVGGMTLQLSTFNAHTCALLDTGTVRCWGRGALGQLGYGNVLNIGDNEPVSSAGDVDVGGKVLQVAVGGAHTCALLEGGTVRCWGDGNQGRLGYPNLNPEDPNVGNNEPPSALPTVDVGGTVVQLAAGGSHTCALLDDGNVRCWGMARNGQLGYGNISNIGDDEPPSAAGNVDIGGKAIAITAGGEHTCALMEGGTVRCWGRVEFGRLGYAVTEDIGDNEVPAIMGDVDIGGKVMRLSSGGSHNCVLLDNDAVRCWGNGGAGRLGYGNNQNIGDDEVPSSAGDVMVK